MLRYILVFMLISTAATWACDNAAEFVRKSEKLMRGNNSYSKMDMMISTSRWKRTVKMEGWSEGDDKSFIKILYPRKDKGVTFLKLDNEMWQYVPKIEKIIKIPPSMMLQSWMGSDFSNDDLVKQSSLSKDYTSKLIGRDGDMCQYELIPHEEAPVVWGKILLDIHKDTYVPERVVYYDEDGVKVRSLLYSAVVKLKDRYFPMTWEMVPHTEDKKGHKTLIQVKEMQFNEGVDASVFTMRALKRLSR